MAKRATRKAAAKPVKAGGLIACGLAAALLAGCASAHVGNRTASPRAKCIWCGSASTGTSCMASPSGRHEQAQKPEDVKER